MKEKEKSVYDYIDVKKAYKEYNYNLLYRNLSEKSGKFYLYSDSKLILIFDTLQKSKYHLDEIKVKKEIEK